MAETRETSIEGVALIPLEPHPDDRGSFTELYRGTWVAGTGPMPQANLSISRANVLRGLHFHRVQADYWCVLNGKAFIGLYDLRSGSPTQGKRFEVEIAAEDQRQGLYIPPGVAHAFYAQTDMQLLYLVDTYFTGEDEFGVAWNDPQVGIGWPVEDPILSGRDQTNPSLDQVMEDAPAYRT